MLDKTLTWTPKFGLIGPEVRPALSTAAPTVLYIPTDSVEQAGRLEKMTVVFCRQKCKIPNFHREIYHVVLRSSTIVLKLGILATHSMNSNSYIYIYTFVEMTLFRLSAVPSNTEIWSE